MKSIALIGMPACGKSTVGRLLAERLGMKFADCDIEIEKKCKMTVSEIFESRGEEYFRQEETKMLATLAKTDGAVISTGGGCVERPESMEKLGGCITVYINRPLEMICKDADTAERPLLKDGTDRVFELFDRRAQLYKNYSDIEILNVSTPDEAVEKIIAEVKKYENNGD